MTGLPAADPDLDRCEGGDGACIFCDRTDAILPCDGRGCCVDGERFDTEGMLDV